MLLRDRRSYLHLFVILKFFSRFTGLRVNYEESELFETGQQALVLEECHYRTCTSTKMSGVYFAPDYHNATRRNPLPTGGRVTE